MLILVDQDNVLADFEAAFHAAWTSEARAHPGIAPGERNSFYLRDQYPPELRAEVEAIYTRPGFVAGLPPIAGAIEALTAMVDQGHDVRICTAPLDDWRNCVGEKFDWVERHLGPAFIRRMIVTKDKTLIRGDILIDDNPEVRGVCPPAWRHLLFDRPFNRAAGGERITWANWHEALTEGRW